MLKKYLLLLVLTTGMAFTPVVMAETFETQSPIYTDEIGRMHFLGKGGYSSVRSVQMGESYSNAVNDAVNKYSNVQSEASKRVEEMKKEAENDFESAKKDANELKNDLNNNVETDITKVIKESPKTIPTSGFKSSFTSKKEPLDASKHQGYSTNIPSGVNDSKTIYTDDLGRMHFFGKGNLIKE